MQKSVYVKYEIASRKENFRICEGSIDISKNLSVEE